MVKEVFGPKFSKVFLRFSNFVLCQIMPHKLGWRITGQVPKLDRNVQHIAAQDLAVGLLRIFVKRKLK